MTSMRSQNRAHFHLSMFFLIAVTLAPAVGVVEKEEAVISRGDRSSPPGQWDQETERLFQGDPTRRLRGVRPTRIEPKNEKGVSTSSSADSQDISWHLLIPAAAVEDEIKSIYFAIGKPLARVGAFKSGGYQKVEQQFAWVATMFGILAEHSQAERWKEVAADARRHFSTASRGAKAASLQAFKNSNNRYEDLGRLIRGEKVDFDLSSSSLWSERVDRPLLMQRLEQSYEQRLKRWSANQAEFEKNRSSLIHEAQILAALAEIIQQPAYEFYDDDDYLSHCSQLKRHAQQVAAGSQESNLEKVQKHLGELSKTCSRCHEGYK